MATKKGITIHTRYLHKNDQEYNQLVEIESQCYPDPWNRSQFVERIRQTRTSCYVAIHECRIVGFLICRFSSKSIEIVNIAVLPEMQRKGIGNSLIGVAIGKLTDTCKEIVLTVNERNLPAQLFFRDCGFKGVSVKRDFYEETNEDAYFLKYTDD